MNRGFCEECKPRSPKVLYEAERGSAHERLYTRAWDKASKAFLRGKFCKDIHGEHGQVLVAAQVTDHIVPHKGDFERFWDRSNWQPLCKHCHDRKTALEDGGFGRRAR